MHTKNTNATIFIYSFVIHTKSLSTKYARHREIINLKKT